MRRNATLAAIGGAAGLAMVGAALLPAAAQDATESAGQEGRSVTEERVDQLTDALAGLVEDGTLTQGEADAVARTLAESDALGPRGGGPGHGPGAALAAAAETLGLDEDALMDRLAEGATLAEVAEEQGVPTAELVDALVAAATEQLEEDVADGRLTQDEADERAAELAEQLTEAVEGGMPLGGPAGEPGPGGPGRGGPGGHGWGGPQDGDRSGGSGQEGTGGAEEESAQGDGQAMAYRTVVHTL